MIGYIEGKIFSFEPDGILLLSGSVGYEILLCSHVLSRIRLKGTGETLGLFIYYHQTERQPRPVLIGFETLAEKEFFQTFITVDAIGPMKAVKALERPVSEIACAIEKKDVKFLSKLPGIGKRSSEKIVAALNGKMERFAADTPAGDDVKTEPQPGRLDTISEPVLKVLVEQLGHPASEAKKLIHKALSRNTDIASPEQLFDEIYREGG
ncbi:MAG: Holliday junction branch migration protein RuvA [Desulfobacteraceae bacterium]